MPNYSIKKIVKAKCVKDALRLEKDCPVVEIWIEQEATPEKAIEGFVDRPNAKRNRK